MRVRAKWLGREATMAKLNRLVPNAEKEVAEAQLDAAREVAGRIAARAPAATGAYRSSIQGDRIASRPAKQSAIGLRGRTTDRNATGVFAEFIWRFLEFGTVKMPARPHIYPTWRAYKKRARRKVATAVNRAVRKVKNG
jgi:HK97 gp10 family phage protein